MQRSFANRIGTILGENGLRFYLDEFLELLEMLQYEPPWTGDITQFVHVLIVDTSEVCVPVMPTPAINERIKLHKIAAPLSECRLAIGYGELSNALALRFIPYQPNYAQRFFDGRPPHDD